MNITSFTTDANGNANVNFTFPQKGTFAGLFQTVVNGDVMLFTSSGSTSALNFRAAMLPAATVSGGVGQGAGSAPGSGVLTVTGTTPHLTLNGTLPSHAFQVSACGPAGNCRNLGSVTTDAQGTASADVGMLQTFDVVTFEASDSSGVEFISAFRAQ
jgi:hypothetical protein